MASKYQPLWIHISNLKQDSLVLPFDKIEEILGFPIDNSFLTYKKELIEYGCEISKISLKGKTILAKKIK